METPVAPEVEEAGEPVLDLPPDPETHEETSVLERGGKAAPRPHTTREAKTRQDKRSSRR
jgi:hypothetical protein